MELGGQLVHGRHLEVVGVRRRFQELRGAGPQWVVAGDVAGDPGVGPAGHQHADVARRPPREQGGDARLAAGRAGALVLVEAIDHQQQPPSPFGGPLGGQLEQAAALPVPSRRGGRLRGRLVGDGGELFDHRLGEGVAVGLAGQVPGHEERHHPDPRRRVEDEPCRQRRLPRPRLGPPPLIGLVAGAEPHQLLQLWLAPAQLNGGDIPDLGLIAGLDQL
jgi:hypothetical protein